MPSYKPPMKDIEFLLNDVLKASERTKDIPAYATADWEMTKMMLDAVSDYAVKTALPLNKTGDAEGCTFNNANGSVKTPKGFKEAYDLYRSLGVIGLSGSMKYNGQEMPHYLGVGVKEIITATNFSLAMYGGLTSGAAKVLEHFASDEIKNLYLPKMYSGDWTGTMCLTEPNSGSDLGGVSTSAKQQADGAFAISGNKIFISCGEHDLSDNICHLVLARLPDAPAGTKGITLFLVPKLSPETNEANGVKCTNIEHKMGINGSSTCAISFENSKGVMIGKPNEGLKAMFTMMNDARLNVGIQGLSLSEIAYQNAAEYAGVRVQGKLLKDAFNEQAKATAIINHANIRKDLVEIKAQIEGFRALAYDAAISLDIAEKHPDAAARKSADDYTSLLTPVLKSCLTDLSCATAQKGIQIHGGMGYCRDMGVEQYYRDALIGTIYEGTNDIQSIDFTFRKALKPQKKSGAAAAKKPSDKPKGSPIPTKGLAGMFAKTSLGRMMIERKIRKAMDPTKPGTALSTFGIPLAEEIKAAAKNPALREYALLLQDSMESFTKAVGTLALQGMTGKADETLINAKDFMDMFSKVAVGRMWLKMMTAAEAKMAADPGAKAFCENKMQLGDVYMKRIMTPEVKHLEMRINAGAGSIGKFSNDDLTP
jgi:alkylation response protein AidB-like acyl-CoA dehydrogenase